MSKFIPAVVAYREGGDNIHWFPFVVVEVDDSVNLTDLDYALGQITPANVLGWDLDYEEFTEYDSDTPGKIMKVLTDQGFAILGVHDAESMTYIAPLED